MASDVRLVALTETEFTDLGARLRREYAAENVASGRWTAGEAEAASAREFAQLLPEGLATRDHFLYSVRSVPDDRHVGVLWLGLRPATPAPLVFIFYVETDPAERRHGFGTATMAAVERFARARGATQIQLNVFASNPGARALYDRLGYRPIATQMRKELGPDR